METMKTWEIFKLIDDNQEQMIGKQFRLLSNNLDDEFLTDDIAKIVQYNELIGLGSVKHSNIRIKNLSGFEEWEMLNNVSDYDVGDVLVTDNGDFLLISVAVSESHMTGYGAIYIDDQKYTELQYFDDDLKSLVVRINCDGIITDVKKCKINY